LTSLGPEGLGQLEEELRSAVLMLLTSKATFDSRALPDGGGGGGPDTAGTRALPEGFTWQLMVVTKQLPATGGAAAADVLAQTLAGGQWAVKNELLPDALARAARQRQQGPGPGPGPGPGGGAQVALGFSDDASSHAALSGHPPYPPHGAPGTGTGAGAGAVVPIKSVGDNGLIHLEITAVSFR
jgi:hypothetical protein